MSGYAVFENGSVFLAIHTTAAVHLPAMSDQVHFHTARQWIIPVGKGAHLDSSPRLWHNPWRFSGTRCPSWQPENRPSVPNLHAFLREEVTFYRWIDAARRQGLEIVAE